MRKIAAGFVIFMFASLLGTSIYAVFHGAALSSDYLLGHSAFDSNYISY